MVESRAIGYVPGRQIIEISSARPEPNELTLTSRRKFLDTVRVVAQRVITAGRLAEFRRRQQRGFGHFLDADDIERANAFFFTDLLRRIPGVTLRPGGYGAQSYQILMRSFGKLCSPVIYVDGIRHLAGTDADSAIWPDDLVAVEVYTRNPPAEFYTGSDCGVIVVWTGPRSLEH
jgi:outer membrane cobalamin receptor